VLDLSKIEAGKLELNLEKVAVAPLVDEVVGTARTLAEQNKNRLSVECPADLPPIEADSMRLRQILLNLLSNACKFTKEGEIALRVARALHKGQESIEFSLTDSGIGMTADRWPGCSRVLPGRCRGRAPIWRNRARMAITSDSARWRRRP
jgi:signal transduction histidine kinase